MAYLPIMIFRFKYVGACFLFSVKFGRRSLLMLILIGMILSGLFSALVSLLQYVSDTEEKLPSIVFWLMGSFATANTEKWLFSSSLCLLFNIVAETELAFKFAFFRGIKKRKR